jgi:hypothetical protein
MPSPPELVVLLAAFAPLFSDRVWADAQTPAIGAILAAGTRSATSAWRHLMGVSLVAHFTHYHRVLNQNESTASGGETPTGSAVPGVDWRRPPSREAPRDLRTAMIRRGRVDPT